VKINGTVLAGQIAALSDASAGSGRVAQIRVAWDNMRPVLGSAAQVSMTLARKDQALVVPRKAVRSTGSRKFVQVVDGTRSKATDVTVGITSGDEVEILTGVTEGQLVVVPD
jgi:hypothetical protein